MTESNDSLSVHVSGDTAVVAGDPELMATLFKRLDIDPTQAPSLGRGAADLLAQVTGLNAVTASLDGSWVQLTPESHRRLVELAKFNPSQDGLLNGVLRGDKGRIDSFAQFTLGGLNPVALSNLATLTAAMALRSAMAQLEDLVQSMDVKLDRLLGDNRARALGDVHGLTQVLAHAFELFEKTGRVTDTTWSQIAGHATALAQATSHALAHIDDLTQSLSVRSFTAKLEAANHIADTELRSWLVILAACQANQRRLETLELVHVQQNDPESAGGHAAAIESAADKRLTAAALRLHSLLNALSSAANVTDFNRVRSPQKSRALLNSAERAVTLVRTFAEIYGLDDLDQSGVKREPWRKSLSDLAKTTTTTVTSAVMAVPVGIARAGGDAVIRAATQIEARRSPDSDLPEPPSDASGTVEEDQ